MDRSDAAAASDPSPKSSRPRVRKTSLYERSARREEHQTITRPSEYIRGANQPINADNATRLQRRPCSMRKERLQCHPCTLSSTLRTAMCFSLARCRDGAAASAPHNKDGAAASSLTLRGRRCVDEREAGINLSGTLVVCTGRLPAPSMRSTFLCQGPFHTACVTGCVKTASASVSHWMRRGVCRSAGQWVLRRKPASR